MSLELLHPRHISFRATSKITRIETNQVKMFSECLSQTFRATSKITRIETCRFLWLAWRIRIFQSNIQDNKDWNTPLMPILPLKTLFQSNIQDNKDWNYDLSGQWLICQSLFQSNIQDNKDWNQVLHFFTVSCTTFQSNIQDNKDWNMISEHGSSPSNLSEQHPR